MSTHKFIRLCAFAALLSSSKSWLHKHNTDFYNEHDVSELRKVSREVRFGHLYGSGDTIRKSLSV